MSALRAKSQDLMRIVASWRLCPNKLRAKILRKLGWTIGHGSAVFWGILPTTSDVHIGEGAVVGHNTFFDGRGSVFIEDKVRMGSYVKILTTTHPIEASEHRSPFGVDHDLTTTIGYGSWLGAGVILLPGVTVARGCVIAAGAVVAKDTQPNGLYAGVPARRLKNLPVEQPASVQGNILPNADQFAAPTALAS